MNDPTVGLCAWADAETDEIYPAGEIRCQVVLDVENEDDDFLLVCGVQFPQQQQLGEAVLMIPRSLIEAALLEAIDARIER